MHPFGRQHLFAAEARSEILQQIVERANQHIGVSIDKTLRMITFDKFITNKFGKYG
jgi:hypothetical protein